MFEDGMAYVALSRVQTLEGVALLSAKIKASNAVSQEMQQLRNSMNNLILKCSDSSSKESERMGGDTQNELDELLCSIKQSWH